MIGLKKTYKEDCFVNNINHRYPSVNEWRSSGIKKIIKICLLALMVSPVHASQLRLDFEVNIKQKNGSLSSVYNPNISFLYGIIIDTNHLNSYQGTISDGRTYSQSSLSSATLPVTSFTSDVQSHITDTLNPASTSTSIYREYSANGYGSGTPATFQAIFLETDSSSGMSQANTWTSYQRGFQRQMPLGFGNLVTTFDSVSFQAYLESLIGDSKFRFTDSFIVSQFFPATNSGRTIDAYGYSGSATLLNVSSVPVPAAVWLFGSGLIGLLSFNRRKNKTVNVITA